MIKKKHTCNRGVFMDKDKSNIRIREVGEDATKYGEFISSYFAWVSLKDQKRIVEDLENMTKKHE